MGQGVQHYRDLAIAAFVAGLCVFGFLILSPAFHIDSELAKVSGFNAMNVSLGRWGTTFLRSTLLRQPFVPFFTPLLSTAFLSLAAVTATSALELSVQQSYVFVILYMACPQFAYQMEFLFQSDCIALGIFLATCSFVALRRARSCKSGAYSYAASVACLVAGMSFYQSLIFIPPTLALVYFVSRLSPMSASRQNMLQDLGSVLALVIVSTLIYSFLTSLIQHETGIARAPWLTGMIGWGQSSWYTCIVSAVGGIARKVLGGGFYGNEIYATTWVAAIVLVGLAYRRGAALSEIVLLAFAAVVAISMPFILNIPFGTDMPPRTFLSEPIAFAGMWAIASRSPRPERRTLSYLIPAVALVFGSYHVSRLAYADMMAFETDKLIGNRIVAEIYNADPDFKESVTPVYFMHGFEPTNTWRQSNFDIFGASFFAWDGGNPDRIMAFLKATGIAELHKPTPEQIASIIRETAALPQWPNPHSVRLIHDVIVVRLGQG